MNHSKFKIVLLISLLPFASIAQSDTNKAVATKDIPEKRNVDGKLYISAGIGASTILLNIYGMGGGSQADAVGNSESAVFSSTVDYGVDKYFTTGLGVAYQTATGFPQYAQNTPYSENLSRLNIAGRFLFDEPLGRHFELYVGLRIGVSFWTDVITPTPPMQYLSPTLGASNVVRFPSLQLLYGFKFFVGNIGLHLEFGLGTPYLAETGLTIRI
jgi:hypothetical protein